MQEIFDMCTDPERMGRGREGAWQRHRGFDVLSVSRIENGRLWSTYHKERECTVSTSSVYRELAIEAEPGSDSSEDGFCEEALRRLHKALDLTHKEPINHRVMKTRNNDAAAKAKDFIRSLTLQDKRNEVLLFHGSPRSGARIPYSQEPEKQLFLSDGEEDDEFSPVYAVKQQGFDDRLSSTHGMFGSGTYFADMVSKADCYAGKYSPNDVTSVGEEAYMFVSRVVLGAPYLADQALEELRRPPCIYGHFDPNLLAAPVPSHSIPYKNKGLDFEVCHHSRLDSVVSSGRHMQPVKLWNEYVIYDKRAYPEFCVRYRRRA